MEVPEGEREPQLTLDRASSCYHCSSCSSGARSATLATAPRRRSRSFGAQHSPFTLSLWGSVNQLRVKIVNRRRERHYRIQLAEDAIFGSSPDNPLPVGGAGRPRPLSS